MCVGSDRYPPLLLARRQDGSPPVCPPHDQPAERVRPQAMGNTLTALHAARAPRLPAGRLVTARPRATWRCRRSPGHRGSFRAPNRASARRPPRLVQREVGKVRLIRVVPAAERWPRRAVVSASWQRVAGQTRFLLSELVALYEADGLLSADDTVIVAAREAWPEYQRFAAYVCQPNRAFRDALTHFGFYAHSAIQTLIPRIEAPLRRGSVHPRGGARSPIPRRRPVGRPHRHVARRGAAH